MLIASSGAGCSSWPGCPGSGCSASAALGVRRASSPPTRCCRTSPRRIDRFLDPASGDTFQVDTAIEAFVQGGWLGQGPGRGHGQAHPARQPRRLHLRGRRRRSSASCSAWPACCCSRFIVLRGLMLSRRNEDAVLPPRGGRAGHAVRPAVGHQHGGQPAPDAGQGHDAAVHLLWRLVADLARARRWASCWR